MSDRFDSLESDVHSYVLYVRQSCARCRATREQLRRMIDNAGAMTITLEIVEIDSSPEVIWEQNILAVPTLRKVRPEPEQRFVGELTEQDAELLGIYKH